MKLKIKVPNETEWEGNIQISDYLKNGYSFPEENGVYRIINNDTIQIKFQNQGGKKEYSIDLLEDKHKHHKDKILYIGKASGNRGLKKRISQYMHNSGHNGGRALWQITRNNDLYIQYYRCKNPEEVESKLLEDFYERQKAKNTNEYRRNFKKSFYYPLCNWKGGTKLRRR